MTILARPYHSTDKSAFIALNLDWIEESFTVEQSDRAQLQDLETTIIGAGGQIIIAEQDGVVVGTGALVPPHHDPQDGRQWLEVIKMAARKDLRGQGIGQAVMTALMAEARRLKADALWLETNGDLKAAIRLYERNGFQHLSADHLWPTPYARCNVQMTLIL